jgi:hypothetical protein
LETYLRQVEGQEALLQERLGVQVVVVMVLVIVAVKAFLLKAIKVVLEPLLGLLLAAGVVALEQKV